MSAVAELPMQAGSPGGSAVPALSAEEMDQLRAHRVVERARFEAWWKHGGCKYGADKELARVAFASGRTSTLSTPLFLFSKLHRQYELALASLEELHP